MLAYGTIGNPNFLGTYTSFMLPSAIVFYMKTNKKLWLLSIGLIYSGLVVSLTRGTWLAFGATFIIITFGYT